MAEHVDVVVHRVLAGDSARLDELRELCREYQQMLLVCGCDLNLFQGLEEELAGLPGKFSAEKRGGLFLASIAGHEEPAHGAVARFTMSARGVGDGARPPVGRAVACIAYRFLAEDGGGQCEMKRLYVRPAARGLRLGEALSKLVCDEARAAGYKLMKLDTLERLPDAVRLYARLGFRRTAAYCQNPLEDAVYFELGLS
jgi:putative acetyltransferase